LIINDRWKEYSIFYLDCSCIMYNHFHSKE